MFHADDSLQIRLKNLIQYIWILGFFLSACLPQIQDLGPDQIPLVSPTPSISPTPVPERPVYSPGELVDYTAHSGDTLTNLAFRFNTTVDEILAENSIIPEGATTLPPGLP